LNVDFTGVNSISSLPANFSLGGLDSICLLLAMLAGGWLAARGVLRTLTRSEWSALVVRAFSLQRTSLLVPVRADRLPISARLRTDIPARAPPGPSFLSDDAYDRPLSR